MSIYIYIRASVFYNEFSYFFFPFFKFFYILLYFYFFKGEENSFIRIFFKWMEDVKKYNIIE